MCIIGVSIVTCFLTVQTQLHEVQMRINEQEKRLVELEQEKDDLMNDSMRSRIECYVW